MTTIEKPSASATEGEFLADVRKLRERVRECVEEGALIVADGTDLERLVRVLNQALAMELVLVSRYKRHFFTANGLSAQSAADEFLEHAADQSEQADRLAARIQQLGGTPNFNLNTVTSRGDVEFDSLRDLHEMIREDIGAERIVVSTYVEIIQWIGDKDPATRHSLEEIVASEEERAKDLLELLSGATY